jgi:hypothetical protein
MHVSHSHVASQMPSLTWPQDHFNKTETDQTEFFAKTDKELTDLLSCTWLSSTFWNHSYFFLENAGILEIYWPIPGWNL